MEHEEPLSIRLDYNDLCGDDVLTLTDTQVNRMTKTYENGRGITIKMSKRQVEHNKTIEAGFFSLLAGLAAKAFPFFGKDRSTNTGDWGTFRGWVGQGHGKRTVFEKMQEHRKSRNRRPRTVFETIQMFRAWHGWR